LPRNVALLFEAGQKVPRIRDLAGLAGRVAKSERLPGPINVVFCSNATIRALNRKYRKLDKVTDVLSFPWNEPDFFGEVYIAPLKAKDQCELFNNSYFNELRRLIVHGVLHLSGYDHVKPKDRKIMREREDFHLQYRNSAKK
jgi:probable rRNA maturation factor